MDAPEHAHLRRLVTHAFTPGYRALQENIRRHARALVDAALCRQDFDATRDLAAELPLLVLADLLGMPRGDRDLLDRWSNNLVGFDDPGSLGGGSVAQYQQTFVDALRYATELAARKRRQPGDDLVSELVALQARDHRFDDTALSHLWLLLVVAGNESTRHLLSGMLGAGRAPGPADRLVADPRLFPSGVEELLRWVSPVMQFRRTAVRDAELEGIPVRAGQKVVLYYTSANRDAQVFADPDRLDSGAGRILTLRSGSATALLPWRSTRTVRGLGAPGGLRAGPGALRADRPCRPTGLQLHERHQVAAGPVRAPSGLEGPRWLSGAASGHGRLARDRSRHRAAAGRRRLRRCRLLSRGERGGRRTERELRDLGARTRSPPAT